MTPYLHSLALIAVIFLAALAVPGPNFFVLTQLSLAGNREAALRTVCGIAMGSTSWAILAMGGVATVLARVDGLITLIRMAGALYLVWLGAQMLWQSWRAGARHDATMREVKLPRRAVLYGLTTSLTNPKSAAFWTSVFATTFPVDAPPAMFLATALTVAAISLVWHGGVALVFTSAALQRGYRRAGRTIDVVTGLLLVAIGGKLASEA